MNEWRERISACLARARACGVHDARLRYHRRRRPCPAFVRTPNNRPNLALYRGVGGGRESFRANKRKLHESQILSANMNELAKAMKDILDSMDFGVLTNLISIQLILLKFCSDCTKNLFPIMKSFVFLACIFLTHQQIRCCWKNLKQNWMQYLSFNWMTLVVFQSIHNFRKIPQENCLKPLKNEAILETIETS